jgi:hypothetical protein
VVAPNLEIDMSELQEGRGNVDSCDTVNASSTVGNLVPSFTTRVSTLHKGVTVCKGTTFGLSIQPQYGLVDTGYA